jgi:aminoglycoside phosphotransferase family enzyme
MPSNPAVSRAGRADAALREKVAWLADPTHYPGRPRAVAVIETHFAWVFLAGARAYKLKKPLLQASMDYRTLARRERACREELRLNRRLAPRVYLGVVPLHRKPWGGLSLRRSGPGGPRIADWLVRMRRLDGARMLDRVIAAGALRAADLDRLAARLAVFFQHAERRPLQDGAYRTRLRREIRRNAGELRARDLGLSRHRVGSVAGAQLDFLSRYPRAFTGRAARLVDGHGDLRPEHVFLGDSSAGVCVIDCLEFDRNLRRLDPAEEIAFLALECVRLGAPGAAQELIGAYRGAAGDPAPPALMHFYMSRRAALRAQIAAWHLRDDAFAGQARRWKALAHSYLDDALRHIRRAAVLQGTLRISSSSQASMRASLGARPKNRPMKTSSHRSIAARLSSGVERPIHARRCGRRQRAYAPPRLSRPRGRDPFRPPRLRPR